MKSGAFVSEAESKITVIHWEEICIVNTEEGVFGKRMPRNVLEIRGDIRVLRDE